MTLCASKQYETVENLDLLKAFQSKQPGRALDVGCGSGANSGLLSRWGWRVTALTCSPAEARQTQPFCDRVLLADVATGLPAAILKEGYDLIVMSHVLEHLADPEPILADAAKILSAGGHIAIAVPNALYWKQRMQYFAGRFQYQDTGIMDRTHLRFYTFKTGRELLTSRGFALVMATGSGHAPMPIIRTLLPKKFASAVDRRVCSRFPGVFAEQLIFVGQQGPRVSDGGRSPSSRGYIPTHGEHEAALA